MARVFHPASENKLDRIARDEEEKGRRERVISGPSEHTAGRLLLFHFPGQNLIWNASSCTFPAAWLVPEETKPRKITRKMLRASVDRAERRIRDRRELGILLTRIVAFNFKPETIRVITVSIFGAYIKLQGRGDRETIRGKRGEDENKRIQQTYYGREQMHSRISRSRPVRTEIICNRVDGMSSRNSNNRELVSMLPGPVRGNSLNATCLVTSPGLPEAVEGERIFRWCNWSELITQVSVYVRSYRKLCCF